MLYRVDVLIDAHRSETLFVGVAVPDEVLEGGTNAYTLAEAVALDSLELAEPPETVIVRPATDEEIAAQESDED